MSSRNYEERGYILVLDLLTISYSSCVTHPRRSEIVGKSDHLRPIYLTTND